MWGTQPQAVALSLPLALAGDHEGTSLSCILCETPSREAHTLAIAPPVPPEPHHYHLVREDKVCGKELPTPHSGMGPGEPPHPQMWQARGTRYGETPAIEQGQKPSPFSSLSALLLARPQPP